MRRIRRLAIKNPSVPKTEGGTHVDIDWQETKLKCYAQAGALERTQRECAIVADMAGFGLRLELRSQFSHAFFPQIALPLARLAQYSRDGKVTPPPSPQAFDACGAAVEITTITLLPTSRSSAGHPVSRRK